jgi:putative transposase
MAVEKMLTGLSTRRYPVGLEGVGEQIAEKCSATGKSAVSRRFVAMTETGPGRAARRGPVRLDMVALMIDGVHFAESCCVVALGIGIDVVKHTLVLVEGSTEKATSVTDLLVGLRGRGLDVTRPMLVGIDGSKVLRKAVVDVIDNPVIQRLQASTRSTRTTCVLRRCPAQLLPSTVDRQRPKRRPRSKRLDAGERLPCSACLSARNWVAAGLG